MNDFAITVVPEYASQQALARKQLISHLRSAVLMEGHDYGTIPGTDKPTLYKAGAERLCAALELSPIFEITNRIERWDDENAMFHYETLCRLIHIPSGREVATALGSCNSKESRYRWRWVRDEDVPHWLDKATLKARTGGVFEFDFAIKKRETSGKYGKPESYWAAFDAAIADGTARRLSRQTKSGASQGWEIGGVEYRIPNDEIFTLTNTILKVSNKRAFVSAVLIASNASEFFTVDIEDLAEAGLMGSQPYTVPVTIERPAEPEQTPELYTVTLETVTHCLSKNNAHYYKFDGGVYTFSREPFRFAGVTEAETWEALPLDEPSELIDKLTATVKFKSEGRYEVVSVQPIGKVTIS